MGQTRTNPTGSDQQGEHMMNRLNLGQRGGNDDTGGVQRRRVEGEGDEDEEEEEDEGSEDGDVVVDLGAVPLGDALGDPHDVPALLLLQLDVGVENAEVELVEEGQLVQLDLQGAHTGHAKIKTRLHLGAAFLNRWNLLLGR